MRVHSAVFRFQVRYLRGLLELHVHQRAIFETIVETDALPSALPRLGTFETIVSWFRNIFSGLGIVLGKHGKAGIEGFIGTHILTPACTHSYSSLL